jgi:hypothetical protein
MELTPRVKKYIDQEFGEPKKTELLEILGTLTGANLGTAAMKERFAAAVVLMAAEEDSMDTIREDIRGDFRDVLVWGGVGRNTWPQVLDERFGPA